MVVVYNVMIHPRQVGVGINCVLKVHFSIWGVSSRPITDL